MLRFRGIDLEDVIIRKAKSSDYEMIKNLVKELYNTLDIKNIRLLIADDQTIVR